MVLVYLVTGIAEIVGTKQKPINQKPGTVNLEL